MRNRKISIAGSLQLYRVPKLHGQFRTARGSARIGALRRRCRCQMLRTGGPISVQRLRAEMRLPRSCRTSLSQSLRS